MYNVTSLAGETEGNKQKIYKLLHRAARYVKADFCFKQSIRSIMTSINLKMPEEIIDEGSAKFIHKIISNEEPKEIYNLIKFPRSRTCVDLCLQYIPKTDRLRRCAVFSGIQN